tara:strand:+ start:388 stop:852 length:465 start_codon:yes stop_codon:yes gene_type:complete
MSKPNKHQVVDRLYKEKLKEIEKYHTGDKTTYLKELDGIGKKLLRVKFKGVFPSDKIPKLNDLSPYCILNLDSSKEPGSHWVALAKNGKDSILYDSFGRGNNEIIPDLKYSGNGRIIDTERDAEQKILETNCGARCIAWLCLFDKYGANVAKMI